MGGTCSGGKKASETIRKKYGEDFYKNIGAKGGRSGRTGGFFANPALARIAGAKGGSISRRGFRVVGRDDNGKPIYEKKDEKKQ